jgi:orotidine-5'-phosphate decarboxylase
MEPNERVILALDVESAQQATRLVAQLKDEVGAFKVGLELFHAAGPTIFGQLQEAGATRIFFDCKLHDIPNTVAGAMRAIARYNLWMVNVHASGGARMIRAAAHALSEAAQLLGVRPPLLLGVTLLTSLSPKELTDELHIQLPAAEYVRSLAQLTQAAGGQGVLTSPWEIEAVREACGSDFLIVAPGIRPKGVDSGDQRRTMTPGEAIRRGADMLVVGRAVTAAQNPREAAKRLLEEIS